jgi:hypothetical protein
MPLVKFGGGVGRRPLLPLLKPVSLRETGDDGDLEPLKGAEQLASHIPEGNGNRLRGAWAQVG